MKKVFQTAYAPPDGNCLQACLASIFELPLEAVPEIHTLYNLADVDWIDVTTSWCVREFKVQPCYVGLDWAPRGFHLIGGKTHRGIDHIVVGYQGQQVHDPLGTTRHEIDPEYFVIFVATLHPMD
jgi:hypothetical protein